MTEQLVTFETARLARAKGFDEVCRNIWLDGPQGPTAVDAPADTELIGGFMSLAIKYKDQWPIFIARLSDMGVPKLLQNSKLHKDTYARPTQDLLARWLREKQAINVNVYSECGYWEINIYSLLELECLWHSGENHHIKNHEEAMELGLLTALYMIL